MTKTDPLIRTKLHLPFTRQELVPRPRLQVQIAIGLHGPLTLVTAPAGFGKTTLVAAGVAESQMRVAWLSLDRDDNQTERFLHYLVAALREANPEIGGEAGQLLAAARQAPAEAILISLINDLDTANEEIVLVLDDYHLISSQAVHEAVTFMLEHCPKTFHMVIATRSDPLLPLTRLRGRGQTIELRATDLSFTAQESAQFLNEVMCLGLDAKAVAVLKDRTEGWIAGLQMAALSMRDRKDVSGFIEGFSGTNRYIMDYLLEEVLASQPPEIQHFLLYTSILERLAVPLCSAVLANDEWESKQDGDRAIRSPSPSLGQSASTLDYLEKANLFLVPLDDERIWYRYHHLFASLLRTHLQKLLGERGVAKLHIRASEWLAKNGSVLEAINQASLALDDERVERLIEQSYMEIVRRGEQSSMRYWAGKLTKELVYRRPWLCIYEAHSRAWFGELDEADQLLEAAEMLIRSEISAPDARAMQGHFSYVKSRVTAMQGDIRRAIELCLAARDDIPASNLSLQFNTRVTLGYEYFLIGDYANASLVLNEAIRTGIAAGALIYTVASYCFMARLYAVQGLLHKSYDTYQLAVKLILESSEEHRDARALVDVGLANVFFERNDLNAALLHLQNGLALLHLWGKADDLILAYTTLARIHLAQANQLGAQEAVEKAAQAIQTSGVFSEARQAVEIAQVKLWLAQGDVAAANRWAASQEIRLTSVIPFKFENEVANIGLARVLIAQNRLDDAIDLLSHLEEAAQSAGRMGRLVEILILKSLALQKMGDTAQAVASLAGCLSLAEPEGYVRIFVDEGRPVQLLLTRWLSHADRGALRDFALHLLSQFEVELRQATPEGAKAFPTTSLVEPLTARELEVLQLICAGDANQAIADKLFITLSAVKKHTGNIFGKLEVTSRGQAMVRARQLGLVLK